MFPANTHEFLTNNKWPPADIHSFFFFQKQWAPLLRGIQFRVYTNALVMPETNKIKTDIVRVEMVSDTTLVYMSDGGVMPAVNTIDDLEEEFGKELFIRIHPCHLINRKYLKSIDPTKNLQATLTSGETLPADQRLVEKPRWWTKWKRIIQ